MTALDVAAALEGTPEWVAAAVERLAASEGESDPLVIAGRQVAASLDAIPRDAVLVTEDALAAALHRAWPSRRNTASSVGLSAAAIFAALRTAP